MKLSIRWSYVFIVLFTAFSISCNTASEKKHNHEDHKSEYICPPCGCEYDHKSFD